ncbi:MAG: hypothetical protein NTU53_23750 [Planctomycetota bacterium]|nr:hypothetical protein [Planctomycetota bacterium]
MFYSVAAGSLAGVEHSRMNRRRVRLRKAGGLAMFLLGVFFFAGFYAVELDRPSRGFYLIWAMVLFLLLAIVVLGAIDLLMTRKLSQQHHCV